jgi:hypothetical protein
MDGTVVFKTDAPLSGRREFRSSFGDRLTKFSSSSSDPTCKFRDIVSNHEKTASFHILFTAIFTNHPIIQHHAVTVTKDGVQQKLKLNLTVLNYAPCQKDIWRRGNIVQLILKSCYYMGVMVSLRSGLITRRQRIFGINPPGRCVNATVGIDAVENKSPWTCR